MPTRLKICGITSLADARYGAGAGADFLGFVFYPASPRNVAPSTVREIAGWVHGPEIVGVFVDEEPGRVNAIAGEAQLTYVQLHGDEPPDMLERIDHPVIKAIRVRPGDTADILRLRIEPYAGAEYILLDTFRADARGGTGHVFDWTIAAELASEFPIMLSGGIHAANVEEAVSTVRPVAVDLSSGIESSPGVKDFDRMADFFRAFESVRDAMPAFSL